MIQGAPADSHQGADEEKLFEQIKIKTAQQRFSAVVQEAADHPVTITRQGRAIAVIQSRLRE